MPYTSDTIKQPNLHEDLAFVEKWFQHFDALRHQRRRDNVQAASAVDILVEKEVVTSAGDVQAERIQSEIWNLQTKIFEWKASGIK